MLRDSASSSPDGGLHAVVVVDMQEYFCKPGHAYLRFIAALGGDEETTDYLARLDRTVVTNIRKLVDRARIRSDLVVVTEFGSPGYCGAGLPPWAQRHNLMADDLIGESIYPPNADAAARTIAELAPQPTDLIVPRSTSGPLAGTDVVTRMRAMGVESVVVTGVATDVCVTGWARELSDSGFIVSVPVDACASPLRRCHDLALKMAIPAFAKLTETTALLSAQVT
jgi:ureidoacrylate peracid hydrolase